jgi:ATP-binding cassette subfamily B protein
MPQEPFLFAGSIKDNISFNDNSIGEEELIKAAKMASLYNTIKSFPHGFDTIVGERGVILSGGQKQRVALARTLIRQAPILILDDPISQVDARTGAAIIDTIRSVAGGRTIIIVSHRLSAVKDADRIIVMEKGCIAESGTHNQLIALDGYYARTFRLQEIEEENNAT